MSAPVGRCVRFLQVARASTPPWGFEWALNRFVGISASDERKAGERTGVVNASVRPTNARSAGIFKGL